MWRERERACLIALPLATANRIRRVCRSHCCYDLFYISTDNSNKNNKTQRRSMGTSTTRSITFYYQWSEQRRMYYPFPFPSFAYCVRVHGSVCVCLCLVCIGSSVACFSWPTNNQRPKSQRVFRIGEYVRAHIECGVILIIPYRIPGERGKVLCGCERDIQLVEIHKWICVRVNCIQCMYLALLTVWIRLQISCTQEWWRQSWHWRWLLHFFLSRRMH